MMQSFHKLYEYIFQMDHQIKPSNIDEDIYLGSIESALNTKILKSIGIKRIITLDTKPLDNCQHFQYLYIKANDFPYEDLLSRFEECHQFIRDGIIRGDKILVHCVAGVSRSATIVISYIMAKNLMSFEDAMALVKKKRNIIDPNHGFRKQLLLYQKMNRKVDALNTDYRHFLCHILRWKMVWLRPWTNAIDSHDNNEPLSQPLSDYFKKLRDFMPENKLNQKQEEIYKCKKCRLYLFNELNVLKNLIDETDVPQVCVSNSIFVEPLNSMLPHINTQQMGPINCPNCFTKIGNFDWNQYQCAFDCHLHKDLNYLVFKIDYKKVDSPLLKVTLD